MTEDEVFANDDTPLFDSDELWDDLEFVLDEWESDGEAGAAAPESTDPALPNPDPFAEAAPGLAGEPSLEDLGVVDQDEHDMLFGDITEDRGDNLLGENRTFSEEAGVEWAGADTELVDLGMNMVDSDEQRVPVHMSPDDDDGIFDIDGGDDLILIDADGDLETQLTKDDDFDDAELAPAAQGGGDLHGIEYEPGDEEGALFEAGSEFGQTAHPVGAGGQGTLDSEFEDFAGGLGSDLGPQAGQQEAEEHSATEEYEEHGDPGIDYNTRDFDVSDEEEDSEWSPVSEFDEDEEDQISEDEEGYAQEEEDPDYSEYEEAYYEETNDFAEFAEERRSPLRWVVGIAAAVLISAAGAFWYLKTDNLTPSSDVKVIDLVPVPRPTTDVKVGEPTKTPKKDPLDTTPPKKDPVDTTPPKKDPVDTTPPKKDPVDTTPPKKDPVGTTPTKDPVGTTPKKDPKRIDPKTPENMLNIGGEDGTSVSERDEGLMARHERSVVKSVNGLVMGSTALAQLTNENIFVGRVKKLSDASITLRTSVGEITLVRTDLRALTTLADAEFEEWKQIVSTGMVKLRNNNRLKGKIVEARDDAVVLMVNSNRVIIPKSAIDSVTSESHQGVNLNTQEEIESDDWFRQLVEDQIETSDAKKAKKMAVPGK